MAQENPCHARSTSLPSTSHPFALRFEEEIQRLNTSVSMQAHPTFEILCGRLRGLASLYLCLDDILSMPSCQQVISQQRHEKWVAEEVECYVRLLDMSSCTRDVLCSIKDQAQLLGSALRMRRADGFGLPQAEISSCVSSIHKAKKEMLKLLKLLKRMEKSCLLCPSLLDCEEDQSLALRCLREAKIITINVLKSAFSYLSEQQISQKSSRWAFLSRETVKEANIKAGSSDAGSEEAFISLCKKSLSKDGCSELMQKLQVRLKRLEDRVGLLDCRLESFFRQMIHTRVALLNITNSRELEQ